MRNKLILLIISSALAIWYFTGPGVDKFGSVDMSGGDGVTMTKGNTKFLFKDLGEFSTDVRVFGKTTMSADMNGEDIDAAPYSLIASPLQQNAKTFNKFMCEVNSLKKASLINVIPQNASINREIINISGNDQKGRTCFTINGQSLKLKKVTYKGDDYTDFILFGKDRLTQFNVEPRKYVLVNELIRTSCD